MEKRWTTQVMVEIAVAAALALVLGMVRVYHMPNGGSVSLEMVPVFYMALRRGVRPGLWTGALLGMLQLLLDAYIVHPVQLILDYPLPFALLGLAGLFRTTPILGVVIGSAARYVAHVLSGVIFWASYAPEGVSPWIYSLSYNATYLVPEMIISAVIIWLLARSPLLQSNSDSTAGQYR